MPLVVTFFCLPAQKKVTKEKSTRATTHSAPALSFLVGSSKASDPPRRYALKRRAYPFTPLARGHHPFSAPYCATVYFLSASSTFTSNTGEMVTVSGTGMICSPILS